MLHRNGERIMLEPASNAAFLKNHTGGVSISLSDPCFVQSDAIVVDQSTLCVFAIFHEAPHYLGSVSRGMAETFSRNTQVVLSALRPDGSLFELTAPVCARRLGEGCTCCSDKDAGASHGVYKQ